MPENGLVKLSIKGMHCASCVGRVERALKEIPGVVDAQVNLATNRARVDIAPGGATTAAPLVEAVKNAGYDAAVVSESAPVESDNREELADWKRRVAVGVIFSVVVMVLEMGRHAGFAPLPLNAHNLLVFLLATVVIVFTGGRFFVSAARGLKHGNLGMDLLISLGVGAAYLYSVVLVFHQFMQQGAHDHNVAPNYFESAAMVLAFVALGKWLELRARTKSSNAIRALAQSTVKDARVLRDGAEVSIPTDQLRVGDIVVVRPGEKIPIDGEVIEGTSLVNESIVTGEPIPVEKKIGDGVTGGAQNENGVLHIRVTNVGENTVLARMIALVERAQSEKTALQRVADRISAVFIPIVLALATITLLGWGFIGHDWLAGLTNAIAVMVIACPCALGLATPTAIITGTGRGAREGILLRDVTAIERARKIQTVFLDKTGTITEGKPMVTEALSLDPSLSDDAMLAIAASVEMGSEHSLARGIVECAREKKIAIPTADDFMSHAGLGVEAIVDGVPYTISSPASARKHEYKFTDDQWTRIEQLEMKGKTVVVLGNAPQRKPVGVIALADLIKPTSVAAVEKLHGMNVQVNLLTGDNRFSAMQVADLLRIPADRVIAGASPIRKAQEIRDRAGAGEKVAMVGDGINDAPALAEADLGIAMNTGADIAMEAAQITIATSNLQTAVKAILLSRAIANKIYQNLGFAFVYNVLLIPAAAFGLLSPMLAGAAMAASSVSVVTNSLTLAKARLK